MTGTVVPPLIDRIQGGVKDGRYTRRGDNRKANLALAQQAASRWYKKDGSMRSTVGEKAMGHAEWVKTLATSLEHSAPPSPAGSRASSRASRASRASRGSRASRESRKSRKSSRASRESRKSSRSSRESRGSRASRKVSKSATAPTLGNLLGASKRGYTRRAVGAPPATGSFAMLMKMVNTTKYLWLIKVEQRSRGQATITTLHGTEGGKMSSHSKTITTGAAGRSPREQALRDALILWEAKKKDGYTEVRAISRKANAGNLKRLNNFIPFGPQLKAKAE